MAVPTIDTADTFATRADVARVAELAACAAGPCDGAVVEALIARVVGGLPDCAAVAGLVAAATDTTRPLHQRVAVLAALHRALG